LIGFRFPYKIHYAALRSGEQQQALELFLNQHAMLGSTSMSQPRLWSFADGIWQDMTKSALPWY
jgi:hypothetical protein